MHFFFKNRNKSIFAHIITSADEIGEVMFSTTFVCLSVCPDYNSKTVLARAMRLSGFHNAVSRLMPIDFGDNPDIRPDIRFTEIP